MPLSLSRYQHDASARSSLILPVVLLVASVLAYIGTSFKHSLLTSATAWLALCVPSIVRAGAKSLLDAETSQRLAWAAGCTYVVAQICERAVEGRTLWWAKALVPALVYCFVRSGILEDPHNSSLPDTPSSPDKLLRSPVQGTKTTLLTLTFTGLAAVYFSSGSVTVVALGLSYSLLMVAALYLVERAHSVAEKQAKSGGGVIYSAHGLFTQPVAPSNTGSRSRITLVRDVSAAAFVASFVASVALEGVKVGLFESARDSHSNVGKGVVNMILTLVGVFVQAIMFGTLLLMVSLAFPVQNILSPHLLFSADLMFAGFLDSPPGRPAVTSPFPLLMFAPAFSSSQALTFVSQIQRKGAFLTSLVPFSAVICLQLIFYFSISSLWFAILFSASTFLFLDEQDVWSGGSRMRHRTGRAMVWIAGSSLLVYSLRQIWWQPYRVPAFDQTVPHPSVGLDTSPPIELMDPLQYTNTVIHPIHQLVQEKQDSWATTLKSQSQTLQAAVVEYKRRYGIPPPPNFDKWFDFAKQNGVLMIDDYDTVYHSLLPFWALSPGTIRGRGREALGFSDNQLMGIMIRDGKILHMEGGPDWFKEAIPGMLTSFIKYLPDMDLAFNLHDEPRVVVPHDELSQLVDIALTQHISKAKANDSPKNAFSSRPKDLRTEKRFEEKKRTRFNVYAHQPTWIPSRLSCSPRSPARALEESATSDNLTAYALGDLGFVYNHTAFTDVCNSPSLSRTHGFFDRPNAFNIVHDLFPIFSQSKMSSFQDILYPSPWYWADRASYNGTKDMDWSKKNSSLWWRGSTTGGFSRNGGWRRQHRQQFVAKLNALDTAKVYSRGQSSSTNKASPSPPWTIHDVPRKDHADLIDVHFTYIGQCDDSDCKAQEEFFDVVEPADMQEGWGYKYLLDIDGNAFSGRFYAFLASKSLTFKMAVFREWHEEWIKPWVHYIPLSLRGNDALEAVRFFDEEEEGRKAAVVMAEDGRDWAGKALRKQDFEAWFFRLLLEYGRVIDDDRESIGFVGS